MHDRSCVLLTSLCLQIWEFRGSKGRLHWHRNRLHLWFICVGMFFRCIIAVVTAWVVEKVPLLALPAGDGNGCFWGFYGFKRAPALTRTQVAFAVYLSEDVQ